MADDLLETLDKWAGQQKILPGDRFRCQDYETCNRSHGNLRGGDSVCMSYVGSRYEHPIDHPEVRLAIIGIDHGRNDERLPVADFRGRRVEIGALYQEGRRAFNQHYRGVAKTAAAIFGSQTECAACAEAWRCQLERRPGTSCVPDMFAQANLVKCANGPTAASRSTPKMMHNCSRLLIEELELLRPTLIIFHGAELLEPFQAAARAAGWQHSPNPGDTTGALHQILAPGLRADVLYLYHPSYGHLDRQWPTLVEPALALLREEGKIPT